MAFESRLWRATVEDVTHATGGLACDCESPCMEQHPQSGCTPICECDCVRAATVVSLTAAMHLVFHEHGDKWSAVPGCGCAERAQAVWDRLPVFRAETGV